MGEPKIDRPPWMATHGGRFRLDMWYYQENFLRDRPAVRVWQRNWNHFRGRLLRISTAVYRCWTKAGSWIHLILFFFPDFSSSTKNVVWGLGYVTKQTAPRLSVWENDLESSKKWAQPVHPVALIFFMENAAERPSHLRIHRDLYAILRHLTWGCLKNMNLQSDGFAKTTPHQASLAFVRKRKIWNRPFCRRFLIPCWNSSFPKPYLIRFLAGYLFPGKPLYKSLFINYNYT